MAKEVSTIESAVSTASFAYPDVPGDVRADLAVRLGRPDADRLGDAFVLSTCLRIEVAVAGGKDVLEDRLERLFGRVPDGGEIRTGLDATTHLFRVAAGLESPIVGEQEVWTQYRQALARAKGTGGVPGRFGKLLEQAVATGRSARGVLPDSPHGSLAAVAAELVAHHPRVAVLGAGAMADAAIRTLQREGTEVVVVARRPERVTVDGVEVWGFDRAEEVLATFPAVISATSAKTRLVTDERLAELLDDRTEPLHLVDLAMPPDFRPSPSATVHYVAIDQLARHAAERVDTADADRAVADAAAEAWRRYTAHTEVGPVIGGLFASADEIVDQVTERFAGRLTDPDDADVLRQAVHTAARTLLAAPVGHLNRARDPEEVAALLAEAFGIDPEG